MKQSSRYSRSAWMGRVLVLMILVSVPLLIAPVAGADATVPSSRTIRVVMDDNYPPYIFKDSEGRLKGILLDQWRLWEQKTGIRVTLVTDAEATKSVGLAERIRAEKANPQADVFWGNESFHTINLAEEGLLQPYESPAGKGVRGEFVDRLAARMPPQALADRILAEHGRSTDDALVLVTRFLADEP